ncbi:MAG: hypothetical protein JRJ79_14190 [Deltaproteobacteria bacterium]|nr:hypothetical protein [Deltaproteobacteria bacterium]
MSKKGCIMNSSAYIEDTLVQHSTIKYMQGEFDSEPVFFYNQEYVRLSPQGTH